MQYPTTSTNTEAAGEIAAAYFHKIDMPRGLLRSNERSTAGVTRFATHFATAKLPAQSVNEQTNTCASCH
jgi:hypothetical protein